VLAQSTNNSPHEDMSLQSDTLTSHVFTLTPYCHVISGEEAHSYFYNVWINPTFRCHSANDYITKIALSLSLSLMKIGYIHEIICCYRLHHKGLSHSLSLSHEDRLHPRNNMLYFPQNYNSIMVLFLSEYECTYWRNFRHCVSIIVDRNGHVPTKATVLWVSKRLYNITI
jgi:hypothetical protein